MPARSSSVRPTWKGSLKLSLIAVPIRVFPATDTGADISFRQLHRKCHTPIQLKKWCPHCDEEVSADQIVKGYESAKDQFVIVEEEDIKKARPSTTHVIDLTHRHDDNQIDPVYIERVYYIMPDNKTAGAPFAVIRDALADRSAIGHVALHGREYLVAVVQRDTSLMMYTLRTAGEVRDLASIDEGDFADVKVKPAEVHLAGQVLDSLEPVKTLSSFTDRYQEALKEMLAKKGAPEVIVEEGAGAKGRGKAPVNLMEALRRSLAQAQAGKKRPAKATAKKSARVIAHPASRKHHRRAS